MSNKKLIISGSRMELKNPLDAPESILLRGLHKKIEPIRPRGLGGRGVPSILDPPHLIIRALL